MNLQMVGKRGRVLAVATLDEAEEDDRILKIREQGQPDPELMDKFCDKLIRACDLIGENKLTGETKVCDTPEEARAWERQAERQGFNMVCR